jgi:hypothetical protein
MGINPTKRTNYQAIEEGLLVLDAAAIASVDIPGMTVEMAEHVENNFIVETPTLLRAKNFDIQLYEDRTQRNNFVLEKLPYDQVTGAILDPLDYEFDLIIQQLLPDGITPVRQWTCTQCKYKDSAYEKSERTSTDNQMRTVTFACKRIEEQAL